eukprot:COSAG01_NODE_1464_length_10228_cov_6.040774_10_plen_227_part_00
MNPRGGHTPTAGAHSSTRQLKQNSSCSPGPLPLLEERPRARQRGERAPAAWRHRRTPPPPLPSARCGLPSPSRLLTSGRHSRGIVLWSSSTSLSESACAALLLLLLHHHLGSSRLSCSTCDAERPSFLCPAASGRGWLWWETFHTVMSGEPSSLRQATTPHPASPSATLPIAYVATTNTGCSQPNSHHTRLYSVHEHAAANARTAADAHCRCVRVGHTSCTQQLVR